MYRCIMYKIGQLLTIHDGHNVPASDLLKVEMDAVAEYRKLAESLNETNIKQRKVLEDALVALEWMWSNMKVIDNNLQSDAFNIPANTISEIQDILNKK